jgi:transcriptional regulator with XRE-family HTH domain
MVDYRVFWGQRIRTLRRAAGYSQRSLSVAMNVDQAVVSRWERGITSPRDDRRLELAGLLGVHPDELFSYEPDGNGGKGEAA